MNHATIHLSFTLDSISKEWIDTLALPGSVWSSSGKTVMQKIGENISLEIRNSGYPTIGAFAQKAGMSPSNLRRILAGKSNPRLSTMKRIADALGKQVNELLVTSKRNSRTRRDYGPSEKLEVLIEMPLGQTLPDWLQLALKDRDGRVPSNEI